MRRSVLTMLSVGAFALPLAAFAAFAAPSDAIKALQVLQKPIDVNYELHGNAEGFYVSAWLKGAASGKKVPMVEAKADVRMTVDVVMPGQGKVRAKAQMRVTDGTAYMMLESVEQSIDPSATADYAPYLKQWYSVSLADQNEKALTELGMSQEDLEASVWRVVDAILQMQKLPGENGGSTYSLKLKRTAWQDLVPVIQDISANAGNSLPAPTNRELAEMRKFFNNVNLHIKVMTDAQDAVTGMKAYVATSVEGVSVVAQGTAMVRQAPLNVEIPTNAQSLDELTSMGTMAEDDNWSDWNTDCESMDPVALLSAQRSGACPTVRPSTRQ